MRTGARLRLPVDSRCRGNDGGEGIDAEHGPLPTRLASAVSKKLQC